jgi:hypothetical protein
MVTAHFTRMVAPAGRLRPWSNARAMALCGIDYLGSLISLERQAFNRSVNLLILSLFGTLTCKSTWVLGERPCHWQ